MRSLLTFFILFHSFIFAIDDSKVIRQSVFKMIALDSYKMPVEVKRARKRYKNLCTKDYINQKINNRLNCEVLKTCKGEDCIEVYTEQGTAFVINEGKTLITAMHVVYQTFNTPLTLLAHTIESKGEDYKRSALSVLEPSFVLLNSSNEIVYDSRKEIEKPYFAFWGDPLSTNFQLLGSRLDEPFGYLEYSPYDFAGIELGRSVAPGLKIGRIVSSRYKGYGFPADEIFLPATSVDLQTSSVKRLYDETDIFIDFQKKESRYTDGELLSMPMDELLLEMGYSEEDVKLHFEKHKMSDLQRSVQSVINSKNRILRDLKLDNDERVMAFSGFVKVGQSGGPIINEEGEVIGILTNNMHQHNGAMGVRLKEEMLNQPDRFIYESVRKSP